MTQSVPTVPFPPNSSDTLIVRMKTAFVTAFRSAFNSLHPNSSINKINFSMEYPMTETKYPSVWIQFSFRNLEKLGIYASYYDEDGYEYMMWKFDGRITLTVISLSSEERDRISSEIIQTYAFSRISQHGRRFREAIQDEPYLHIQYNEDRIESGGQGVVPGTPWGSDQLVYTDEYSIDVIGQFRSDIDRTAVEPEFLSEIRVEPEIYVKPVSLNWDDKPASKPIDPDEGWV